MQGRLRFRPFRAFLDFIKGCPLRYALWVAITLLAGCALSRPIPSAEQKTRTTPSAEISISDESRVEPTSRDAFEITITDETAALIEDSGYAERHEPGFFDDILADHRQFYRGESLMAMVAGLGVGAVLANTSLDQQFRDYYQHNIRHADDDFYGDLLHKPKILGEGKFTIPLVAATALVGNRFEEGTWAHAVGDWGERSFRGYLVGAPPMLALQMATGASRPRESPDGSRWHPFEDNNGVSGHSFMGAVPLITAAKMTDSPLWKTAFYAGSTLPGISRINDDAHYASQAVLGWWLAYLAASAVDRTEQGHSHFRIEPLPTPDGMELGVVWER